MSELEITREWLEGDDAREEMVNFFIKEGITDPVLCIKNLIEKGQKFWAHWLVVRILSLDHCKKYCDRNGETYRDWCNEHKRADDPADRGSYLSGKYFESAVPIQNIEYGLELYAKERKDE